MRYICTEQWIELKERETDKDHTHLLISLKPQPLYTVSSKIAQRSISKETNQATPRNKAILMGWAHVEFGLVQGGGVGGRVEQLIRRCENPCSGSSVFIATVSKNTEE